MSKKPILDPACGAKKFYYQKDCPLIIYGDIRDATYIASDNRKIEVHPDVKMDFRKMPFKNESFYLVVFDPPHLLRAGTRSYLAQSYGVLKPETWKEDLKKGFDECWRVLKPNGTLIFKWSEYDIPTYRLIQLLGRTPIFGNRRPKSQTHWLVFFKEEKCTSS